MAGRFVGQSVPRVDGAAKVRGQAQYVDDIVVPGALFGATVRSDVAQARASVASAKDPSFDWSGVTVLTHEDVPHNVVALIEDDQPLLAAREIRHCVRAGGARACADPGAPPAGGRARSRSTSTPLPAVLTLDDALDASADHPRRRTTSRSVTSSSTSWETAASTRSSPGATSSSAAATACTTRSSSTSSRRGCSRAGAAPACT